MKAIITVVRKTEYSSIVEMSREQFEKFKSRTDGEFGHQDAYKAEAELNRLIDTKDWQSDDFDSLEEFEEFKD
jgi:hypothetical protein